MASRAARVVCSSLAMVQALPLNTLPSHTVTRTLNNNRECLRMAHSLEWFSLKDLHSL